MHALRRIILTIFIVTGGLYSFAYPLRDSTNLFVRKDSSFFFPIGSDALMLDEMPDPLSENNAFVPENDSIQRYIDLAKTLVDKLRTTQNFIKSFDANTKFELPVGISKSIGGLNYDIAIYAVRIKPEYAEIDVFMRFEIPQNGKPLTFMARGIKVSNKGGIIGDAKLELLSDNAINFSGDKVQLLLKGGRGKTYVTMDCDGFKQMSLDADVIFSRDLLVPENLDGSIQQGRVTASFNAILNNWNDLVVELTLPPFQVTNFKNFGFNVNQAVFDFSDIRNAPNVVFPADYSTGGAETINLWRGVYMRDLTVRLPEQLRNGNNSRTTLSAHDLLIDHQGVSGTFTGTNLIALKDGDMSGWSFSIDALSVTLAANQIQEAGFNGDIVIPVADEQTPFHYTASIGEDNNYLFTATAGSDMQFKLWQTAKVEINKSSRLEIKVVDGKFMPKAVLHGKLEIAAKLSERGQGASLADIRFENLQIQSQRPFISVGSFSFGSETAKQKVAGFPVSISNIGLKTLGDTQTGLAFDLKVNLVGENASGFAAETQMTIVAQLNSTTQAQRWNYKDVNISSLMVDIDNGDAFKFKGSIAFYRGDATYGDGFNGVVDATFLSKLTVKGTAIFGNVNGNRYWYVDALAEIKPGIPIFPAIALSGFGGGAYYGMKLAKQGQGSDRGKTQTGIVYVPEPAAGLGLKATIEIATTPSPSAFNGDATFEIAFFKSGGIRYISFSGNAFLATSPVDGTLAKIKSSADKMVNAMSKLDQAVAGSTGNLLNNKGADEATIASIHGPIGAAAGKRGQISARIFIEYDFEARTLHANFNAGIDVAGGLIRGGGEAVLHFGPGEWYVYIGVPDNRFNLGIGIGPIRANADAYFMVGTKIPGSPPPPEAVSRILGGGDYNYMKDLNAIGQGGGFAFGTSLSINTGDLQFLIFYARFEAGVGFDIMLKNYGDIRCEGSGDRIGVNGWYANGQAYAYFDGEIGIKVDLFFVSGKFQILSIGAAALLQTKLPNPTWFRGTVGGYFSILNGLVEGSCRFEVTLGSECKFIKQQENILSQIKVIAQVTPVQGEQNVNVFNSPQAVFNMAVDKEFNMNEGAVRHSYRIKLDQFKFTADGVVVAGTQQWNERHDVLAFNPTDIFPPRKTITALVQVSFEEQKNGVWTPVLFQGKPVIESMQTTFTTGDAPDFIPLSNVAVSYPVIGQMNFYKDESRDGYIRLKQGQPYLFEPNSDWKQTGRFTSVNGKKIEFNFIYSSGVISFSIPDLATAEFYSFELVNIPVAKSGPIDRNVKITSSALNVDNQSTGAEIKTRQAVGSLTELEEKSIFTAYFRSSKYETLAKKVNSQNLSTTLRGLRILWRVHFLKTPYQIDEPFDKAELRGNAFTGNKPLLTFSADISDNRYYQDLIYPLVYEGYPIDGDITIGNRAAQPLGIPPVAAVNILQTPDNIEVDQTNPYNPAPAAADQYYFYDLPNYMSYDFNDIQAKAARRYLGNPGSSNPRIEKILWSQFPMMSKGQYKVNIQYRLPSKDGFNSVHQITLNNPVGE